MAIILLGKTKCSICTMHLQKGEDYMGFPAFLNREHKLHEYSDSAFHTKCFEKWERRDEFIICFNQFEQTRLKIEKPEIPEEMSFDEFEKTEAFTKYMENLNGLYKET